MLKEKNYIPAIGHIFDTHSAAGDVLHEFQCCFGVCNPEQNDLFAIRKWCVPIYVIAFNPASLNHAFSWLTFFRIVYKKKKNIEFVCVLIGFKPYIIELPLPSSNLFFMRIDALNGRRALYALFGSFAELYLTLPQSQPPTTTTITTNK